MGVTNDFYDTMFNLWMASGLPVKEFYDAQGLESDNRHTLTFDGFRSAMYRRRIKEMENESSYSFVTPSEKRLSEKIEANNLNVRNKVSELLKDNGTIKGVFISDVHIPYTDWQAFNLACKIIEDFNPDYITGLNDVFDFQDFSRWGDSRSPSARLWDSDLQNPINAHGQYMSMLKSVAPNAIIEGLMGNHDRWMIRYLKDSENRTSVSEWAILHFIEELEKQGLSITSLEEKPVYLTESLVLTHGVFASANVSTTAQKTVEAYGTKQYADESGKYFNTIAGHDHRFYTLPSHGVVAYGNGCLCRTDMSYLKTPPNWQLGITLFYSNNNRTWAYPLVFQNSKGYLQCIWNDKNYSVMRS